MKSYLIVICLITFSALIYSQSDESIVAQVGNDKITAKEFKLRLELSPYLPKDLNMQKDSIKYDFLYSLIAEKIWALNAKNAGIENSADFNFFFKPVEELFVRDALFKQEIESKVKITSRDIEKGIYKSQFTQVIRFFAASDSVKMSNLYKLLTDTTDLNNRIKTIQLTEDTTINVKFGDLDLEETEDSVYSLKKGSFSSPIKRDNNWMIFYCLDNIYSPINLSDQKVIEDIKKVIKRRKMTILYNEYRTKILKGTNVKFNPVVINLITKSFWEKLKAYTSSAEDNKKYFELKEKDFRDIYKSLDKKELQTSLFKIKKKDVTLNDLLSKIAFTGFSIKTLDSLAVYSKVINITKKFVEEQVLTEEGYKKNYHLLKSVQDDLKLWRQKYLAQMFMASKLDSIKISDNDLLEYYQSEFANSRNVIFVKFQMVTLNDLDEMSSLFNKIKSGIEFEQIAKSYGRTDSLLNDNGETELLPLALLGDLKNVISGMHINEIFGPVKRSNGYSIIKLVEKVEKSDSSLPPFEDIKSKLITDLRMKKLMDTLEGITKKTALQQNVKIFNSVVDQIKSSEVPVFVHRLMGFGGQVAGVPLTSPFSGWVNELIKKQILP